MLNMSNMKSRFFYLRKSDKMQIKNSDLTQQYNIYFAL